MKSGFCRGLRKSNKYLLFPFHSFLSDKVPSKAWRQFSSFFMVCLQVHCQRFPSPWKRIDFLLFSILLMATQKCSLTWKIFRNEWKGFFRRLREQKRPRHCCVFISSTWFFCWKQKNQAEKKRGKPERKSLEKITESSKEEFWSLFNIKAESSRKIPFSRYPDEICCFVLSGYGRDGERIMKSSIIVQTILRNFKKLIFLDNTVNPFISSALLCLRIELISLLTFTSS